MRKKILLFFAFITQLQPTQTEKIDVNFNFPPGTHVTIVHTLSQSSVEHKGNSFNNESNNKLQTEVKTTTAIVKKLRQLTKLPLGAYANGDGCADPNKKRRFISNTSTHTP